MVKILIFQNWCHQECLRVWLPWRTAPRGSAGGRPLGLRGPWERPCVRRALERDMVFESASVTKDAGNFFFLISFIFVERRKEGE